jgi:hypothetical protein
MSEPYRYPVIWLEPECPRCWNGAERLWCQDKDALNPCGECGLKPIRYRLDDTHLAPEQPGDYPDE